MRLPLCPYKSTGVKAKAIYAWCIVDSEPGSKAIRRTSSETTPAAHFLPNSALRGAPLRTALLMLPYRLAQLGDDLRRQPDPIGTVRSVLGGIESACSTPLVDGRATDVQQFCCSLGGVATVPALAAKASEMHLRASRRDVVGEAVQYTLARAKGPPTPVVSPSSLSISAIWQMGQ